MTEFSLIQISDTHLARHLTSLTDNFERVSEYIDTVRPDLVVNTGDVAFDAPGNANDLQFARNVHASLPVPWRCLPGNHDIGDNPTSIGPVPSHAVTDADLRTYLSVFGEDRWRFDAAGWRFIGLNSLVVNTGLSSEAEQFDWLAGELSDVRRQPVALFLHKPLFLDTPDAPDLPDDSFRYVPLPGRTRLIEMLGAVDLRLVASGHVHQRRDFTHGRTRHIWAPSAAFVISDAKQATIGIKEVGLVEYRFRPDAFEVRFTKAPGQSDIDLDSLLDADPTIPSTGVVNQAPPG